MEIALLGKPDKRYSNILGHEKGFELTESIDAAAGKLEVNIHK